MPHFTHIKKFIFAGISAVSFSSTSFAHVTHLNEHGFSAENSVFISAPKEQIWDALVNKIDKWWPKDHTWWGDEGTLTLQPVAGGCFCESAGDNSAEHLRISFIQINSLLRMTGGLGPLQGMGVHGALNWQFTQQDNNITKLTLTYQAHGVIEGDFAKLAPIVDKVQNSQLNALAHFVEQLKLD